MNWWPIRCNLPRRGQHQVGACHGVMMRIAPNGDIEAKCHKCNRIQTYSRETLEQYRYEPVFST